MKTATSFLCPSCNEPVETTADYIARGMVCPACKTGFIPVKVELKREIGIKGAGNPAPWVLGIGAMILVGSGITLFIPGMVFGGFIAVIGAILFLKK